MIAISVFLCATLLKLCFPLPTLVWWISVACVVFSGLSRAVSRGVTAPPSSLVAWVAAFLLFKCASLGWSIDINATAKDLFHFIGIFIFAFAVLQLLKTEKSRRFLGIISLWAGSLLILFLLFLILQYSMKYGYVSGRHFKYVMSLKKGFNIHAMTFTCGVLAAIMFLYIASLSGFKKWLLTSFYIIVPMISIYFAGARSVTFFLVIFYLSFLVLHFFKNVRRMLNVAMIVAMVGFLLYIGFGENLLSKGITQTSTYRNLIWSKTLKIALDSPVAGYGYGTAGRVLGQITRVEDVGVAEGFGGGAHNVFLNALVEGGPVGLLLVATFFIIAVSFRRQRADNRYVKNILLALILGLWARGFVEVSGLFGAGNGVADYVSWLAVAAYFGCRESKPTSVEAIQVFAKKEGLNAIGFTR